MTDPVQLGMPAATAEHPAEHPAEHSACGCHEVDVAAPELDARAIPHAIRHGTIFGAFSQVRPGAAMVLIAPHDPKPLLAQLVDREGDAVEVSYLQRGPEAWRLLMRRTR